MKINLLLLLGLFVIPHLTFSQTNFEHPSILTNEKLKGGELYLNVESKNFFINNEYSQPVVKGYTLPGQTISPLLQYLTSSEQFLVEVGLQAKHFFGQQGPLSVFPLLTAELRFTPTTQFIMGTLRGDVNHRASDLIFQKEFRFTNDPEYGVQIQHKSEKLWADIWMNWESFIEHGDTIPEMFTTGVSVHLPLYTSESGWNISTPIQSVIVHVGGEISSFEENGRSDFNGLIGLDIQKESNKLVDKWGLFGHYLGYREFKSQKNNAYPNGRGVNTGAFIQKGSHHFQAGWWYGEKFLSLRGNPIYQSASNYDDQITFHYRSLLSAKYALKHQFADDLIFSLLLEGYYDLNLKNLDYCYGIQLLYTPQIFLKKM